MPELYELSQLMTTPRDLIRWAATQFEKKGLCFAHGTDNALDEAAALVTQCLKLPHDLPGPYYAAVLTPDERQQVLQWIRRRAEERVPLPYITGRAWFAGLEFKADPRALIPRSPIAELIGEGFEPWLAESPDRILDLCTGGGSIAIACAHAFPDAQVDAADLSPEALELARENAVMHHLEERIELLQGDMLAPCRGRRYDLIVCNPPYVGAEEFASLPPEFDHEPGMALHSGQEGLDLVLKLLDQVPDFLEPEGVLVCEVGASAAALVTARPDLPLFWPDFERGGDGVFVISREDLLAAQEAQ